MDPANLFAAIVNSTDAAVISKGLDGTILSWNPAAEHIFGWTAAEMVGQSIRTIIPPDRQHEEDFIAKSVINGQSSVRLETKRLRKDGSLVDIAVLVSPVREPDGTIVGASKIARDITGEVRTREALSEIETRFSLMADNIAQLAWIADREGWIFWYNKRWFEYTGTGIEDMQGWGWQKVHHPDHVDRVSAHIRQCFTDGTAWEDTFPLRGVDGTYRWFLSRAVPLRGESGEVVYWFGTNTDITEQRAAERQIELLLMEVEHRSRNMLTVIQAIAERTVADGGDFMARLRRRIAGIAANQDVLVRRNWRAVPIGELVEAQLAFLEQRLEQIDRGGPALVVQPSAAETIAMTLHELATNAEKYGALSVAGGKVDLQWAIESGPEGDAFVLSWLDSGGPAVNVPDRPGFGSRIIVDVPRTKLGAEVLYEFLPDGVRFVLRCPAGLVIEAQG